MGPPTNVNLKLTLPKPSPRLRCGQFASTRWESFSKRTSSRQAQPMHRVLTVVEGFTERAINTGCANHPQLAAIYDRTYPFPMRRADDHSHAGRHAVELANPFLFWKATLAAFALASFISPGLALQSDTNTLLLLHFENNLTGEAGETPVSASGVSFEL